MMQKKLISMLVNTVFLLGLTIGLNSSAVAQEKVTLRYWTWHPGSRNMCDEMVKAFEEKHPYIDVDVSNITYMDHVVRLKTAFAAGNLPDVAALEEGFMTALFRDGLVPLNDYAEYTWGPDWENKFYKVALEFARLADPGRELIYSFPYCIQTIQIWYNKTFFRKAGIGETPPRTYNEMLSYAKKIKPLGVTPFIVGGADTWKLLDIYLQVVDQTAPDMFEQAELGKVSFMEPGFIKALEIMKHMKENLWQRGAMGMTTYPEADSIFWTGAAAMYPTGTWGYEGTSYGKPDVAKNVDLFAFPPLETGGRPTRPVGGIDCALAMSKTSAHKEEAWKFIKSMVAEEGIQVYYCKYGGEPPALKGLEIKPEYIKFDSQRVISQKILKEVENITLRRHLLYPELRETLVDVIAGVCTGKITPEEGMKTVEAVSKKTER